VHRPPQSRLRSANCGSGKAGAAASCIDWLDHAMHRADLFLEHISCAATPPPIRPSSTAVPTVGWPANGNSRAGVKDAKPCAMEESDAGKTKTVSGWLNSNARSPASPRFSSRFGNRARRERLPTKRRSVNTSSVAKRRCIDISSYPFPRQTAGSASPIRLRVDQQHFTRPGLNRAAEHPVNRRRGKRHRIGGRA